MYLLDTAALLAVLEEAKGQPRQSCLLAEGIQKHRVAAAGQETAQDTECRKQLGSILYDAFQDLRDMRKRDSNWYNYR